jgi:transcription elongation GreA/GreB family factor
MLPEDIIIAADTPAGTRALRDYLDFAKRGILTSTEVTGREEDSDFEISVGDMLRNRGYEVVPQVGVAGFFIDLAVRNPDRPGEFLAAVECDGASYHSSASARDRDRIRQSILESLGWRGRIWRIWSTDWFYNPRRESEKLINFLEERREISKTEQIDYEMEEVFEEDDTVIIQPAPEAADDASEPSLPVASEELYVEVGDLVTYCHVDNPDERKTAMIVEAESNTQKHFVNENTPLAKAILDSAVGDTVGIVVNGGNPKVIKILKIQRQ